MSQGKPAMNASFHRKIHLHPGSIKSHVNAYLQPEKLLFMHMLLLFVRSGPWFYKKQKGAPKDGVPLWEQSHKGSVAWVLPNSFVKTRHENWLISRTTRLCLHIHHSQILWSACLPAGWDGIQEWKWFASGVWSLYAVNTGTIRYIKGFDLTHLGPSYKDFPKLVERETIIDANGVGFSTARSMHLCVCGFGACVGVLHGFISEITK